MFEHLGFSESEFSDYIWHQGKLEKLDVKKLEKKSAISEVSKQSEFSTWPSRSVELHVGSVGVKWVPLG